VHRAVAIAAAVLASSPAAAAQTPHHVIERGCGLTLAQWTGRYQTRDGHAVRAVWDIATRFECDNPELHMDVQGLLLRDGRVVDGVDASGSCDAEDAQPCTKVGAATSRTLTGRLSGQWQLRVTVHVRGADVAVMDGDGCSYDALTVTMTCEATSRPVRLP
jgi:hypothetical protein